MAVLSEYMLLLFLVHLFIIVIQGRVVHEHRGPDVVEESLPDTLTSISQYSPSEGRSQFPPSEFLPPEVRKISRDELDELMSVIKTTIKRCTVATLNLADLTGSWHLAAYPMAPIDVDVSIQFENDRPRHLTGQVYVNGASNGTYNYTQVLPNEMPGFFVDIRQYLQGPMDLTATLLVAHKRHRYFVVFSSGGMGEKSWIDWSVYVRVHRDSDGPPKSLSPKEMKHAVKALRCLESVFADEAVEPGTEGSSKEQQADKPPMLISVL